MTPIKSLIILIIGLLSFSTRAQEHSVAEEWNETLLASIRKDFARPTVHARNLWHTSAIMYDIWALSDSIAEPYFVGNTVDGFEFPFDGFDFGDDPDVAHEKIEEAMSYALYRLLFHRFANSAEGFDARSRFNSFMNELGYDRSISSTDYGNGSAAALGNHIGNLMIQYGLADGSNEQNSYQNQYYTPVNDPLVMAFPGNPDMADPNRWQPLTLDVFIDQSGNEIPFNTPQFLSPEWGEVFHFSIPDDKKSILQRDGDTFTVYHDPGPPPLISDDVLASQEYKKGFSMVAEWSSQLDPSDGVMIDISPRSLGNAGPLPELEDYYDYYDYMEGGDASQGYDVNPSTGQPYETQMVPRGDYCRVLAEFWADGPDSETPPGHWFTLMNYVNNHPLIVKRFNGQGPIVEDLEWDVKSYFMLGAAMHDAAVSTWSIKGYHDYLRPVSAIRYMASKGQSTNPNQDNYHPHGFELIPGSIEVVSAKDPLRGDNNEHVGKIKIKSWKGPDYINDPLVDVSGVAWILAEEWWPYQRPSFVTPPFAGYLSGHSTFSRAAADIFTNLTGDEYFPGGMGEFSVTANDFLVFEEGPSQDFTLQWATYRDASDQTSLSRIYGGIHPPADDIPGRQIGSRVAADVFSKAQSLFFVDRDNDGYYNIYDCDDQDATVYPGAPELCDDKDNDCDGETDEELPLLDYYVDADGDGFGDVNEVLLICSTIAPEGYSTLATDCDDQDASIHPNALEICDDIDNNCNGQIDEDLPLFTYYVDSDEDGFGDDAVSILICYDIPSVGYVVDNSDCNDADDSINPDAIEICDDIDNNCDGQIDEDLPLFTYYKDTDEDGFGDDAVSIMICYDIPSVGYVVDNSDCNDVDASINPDAVEICDDIDNNCDGQIDEELPLFDYYLDNDMDGFGDSNNMISICYDTPPVDYVVNGDDCDDQNADIYPGAPEISDNGIDEDCNGIDLFQLSKLFPNPVENSLTVHIASEGQVELILISTDGKIALESEFTILQNRLFMNMDDVKKGVYLLRLIQNDEVIFSERIVKL